VTLLAPAFLLGLLAIGLPIWLHRLSSENPNRKPFSSLMFLEAGEPRRVLAKNLRYLLLLALRIGVLALLALAFSQPALWLRPEAAIGDSAQLHVVVLDTSASMSYGNRWARARSAALDLLGTFAPDDRAQLVAAGRITALMTGVTVDRGELRAAIAATSPDVFYLDYGQLMRTLDGVLRDAELPVVLHLITDAQQAALPTRFAELAPRQSAELMIHDIAPVDEDNWAVDSLVGSALSGELQAGVRSYAEESAEKTLRLELNGRLIDEQILTIEAQGRSQVSFDALDLADGSNRVSVSLTPNDDLPLDDSRFVALQRPEPRPVLLVSGDFTGSDTLFIASAMDSLSALALVAQSIAPNALEDETLADYHFVVVADAAALGGTEIEQLEDYVESGGTVLLALGPRSTALTVVPLTDQQFLAGGGALRGADYASIGAIDVSHPALQGVESLRAAKFDRFMAIQPTIDDEVLISLDSGEPLLLESELGDGRVLVFTSSLDRTWNDLPVQPAFVPLVAGLANHMLGGAGFSNEADLGSTLALRAMGLQGGQIFDPAGEPALGLGGGTDDVLLDQIGFYEFVSGGSTDLVAVNFDSRESDLSTMDAETIERWQGLGRRTTELRAGAAALEQDASVLSPLGQWILVFLLAAVIMESCVGNWHLRVRRGIAA